MIVIYWLLKIIACGLLYSLIGKLCWAITHYKFHSCGCKIYCDYDNLCGPMLFIWPILVPFCLLLLFVNNIFNWCWWLHLIVWETLVWIYKELFNYKSLLKQVEITIRRML